MDIARTDVTAMRTAASHVMAGPDPDIHAGTVLRQMAGSSPAMTWVRSVRRQMAGSGPAMTSVGQVTIGDFI
jgi:hypothetical protein